MGLIILIYTLGYIIQFMNSIFYQNHSMNILGFFVEIRILWSLYTSTTLGFTMVLMYNENSQSLITNKICIDQP